MFYSNTESGYKKVLDGISMKTLVYGDKTLLVEFHLEKGSVLPQHNHPNEQTGYLVKGALLLSIGGEEQKLKSGDSWCVPSDVMHGATALENCIAIEIFSPVRKDYLP